MNKVVSMLMGIMLLATTAMAANSYSTLTGNVEGVNGAAANTRVYFQIPTLQSFGGSTIYPSAFSVVTDGNGNLPVAPPVLLPYGALVNVSIGNGQPRQIQIPTQSASDLWTLIAANTDPPSLVSQLASSNCTIINPPMGSIGTATINCGTTGSFPLVNNVTAQGFKITNQGAPSANGDGLVWGDEAQTQDLTIVQGLNGNTLYGPILRESNLGGITPFTLPDLSNAIMSGVGTLGASSSVQFPIQTGTYAYDGTIVLVLNSTLWCTWNATAAANQTSGNTHVNPSLTYSTSGLTCGDSTTSANINITWVSGAWQLSNTTGGGPYPYTIAFHTGAF